MESSSVAFGGIVGHLCVGVGMRVTTALLAGPFSPGDASRIAWASPPSAGAKLISSASVSGMSAEKARSTSALIASSAS